MCCLFIYLWRRLIYCALIQEIDNTHTDPTANELVPTAEDAAESPMFATSVAESANSQHLDMIIAPEHLQENGNSPNDVRYSSLYLCLLAHLPFISDDHRSTICIFPSGLLHQWDS